MRALAGVALASVVAVATACASASPGPRAFGDHMPHPAAIAWDIGTGILTCHLGEAELTVPAELRDQVQVNPDDEALIVSRQSRSALVVATSGFPRVSDLGGILGDMPHIWASLHEKASGDDLRRGDVRVEAEMRDGRFVANYTVEPRPVGPKTPSSDDEPERNRKWRLLYIEAGRCRVAAVACTDLDDKPPLLSLLDALRTPPNRLVSDGR